MRRPSRPGRCPGPRCGCGGWPAPGCARACRAPSCTISSARSVSTAAMPCSSRYSLRPISWVAIDLTLTTSSAPVARTRSVTIRLASCASVAQCTTPPRAVTLASSCSSSSGSRAITSVLIAEPASRSASQSGISSTTSGPFGADGGGGVGEVAAQLGVRQRLAGGLRERLRRRAAAIRSGSAVLCRRGTPRNVAGLMPGSPWWTPGFGQMDGADAGCRLRDRPPPMCIRQDESPAVQTSAPVVSTLRDLVGEHRRRGVGVLQREGAAETAAGVGLRQLDQVDALHRPQQATAACRRPAASAASGRSGGR